MTGKIHTKDSRRMGAGLSVPYAYARRHLMRTVANDEPWVRGMAVFLFVDMDTQ